jgi:hypothetical protein
LGRVGTASRHSRLYPVSFSSQILWNGQSVGEAQSPALTGFIST